MDLVTLFYDMEAEALVYTLAETPLDGKADTREHTR